MNNLTLYLATVLIWGSTWLAITFQFGKVPPEVSVAYRFTFAGVILLVWSLARRLPLRFSAGQHLWMAIQGVLLFGMNYICVYLAESNISSGLVAVLFSLIVFLNIGGARLFFGTPSRPSTLVAAVLGVAGVTLVFLPQVREPAHGTMAAGITYAAVGAVLASLGNMVSARNQRNGLPVVSVNTFGMFYGALFVALYAWVGGRHFTFDFSAGYLLSLGYLALFGSVIAFGAYLTLVGRIGAGRAGYFGAATPVIAVLLSVAFEGLKLNVTAVAGIALCVGGNILVLRRRPPAPPAGAAVAAVRDRG